MCLWRDIGVSVSSAEVWSTSFKNVVRFPFSTSSGRFLISKFYAWFSTSSTFFLELLFFSYKINFILELYISMKVFIHICLSSCNSVSKFFHLGCSFTKIYFYKGFKKCEFWYELTKVICGTGSCFGPVFLPCLLYLQLQVCLLLRSFLFWVPLEKITSRISLLYMQLPSNI